MVGDEIIAEEGDGRRDAAEIAGGLEQEPEDDAKSTGQEKESLPDILARHQREIKELQKKEISLKKASAKGSKAEQKSKKKLAEEEIGRLEHKIKVRHANELSLLGFSQDEKNNHDELEGLVRGVAGVSIPAGSKPEKLSKGQKWREKRALQEAQREQRIQEEQSNTVSSRVTEAQNLEKKLQPLGLTSKQIKPDGHCLYHAVEHQLSLYAHICRGYSYLELRSLAANYMRAHAKDFMPFLGADSTDEENSNEDLMQKFLKYCSEVESSASWGGQLELEALAHSLKKHIVVFSTDLPDVEMGKEYKGGDAKDADSTNPTLRLSYHRHAFGLGEHYNSVVPLQTVSF